MIKAYFDGACEPKNPGGVATWGIVVFNKENIIHKDYGLACKPYTPRSTNNYAEYTALIKVLGYCIKNNLLNIKVFGDSQLVIRQMTGIYAVKSPNIIPLYNEAKRLEKQLNSIEFQWIRREFNEIADEMSKKAYVDFRLLGG